MEVSHERGTTGDSQFKGTKRGTTGDSQFKGTKGVPGDSSFKGE